MDTLFLSYNAGRLLPKLGGQVLNYKIRDALRPPYPGHGACPCQAPSPESGIRVGLEFCHADWARNRAGERALFPGLHSPPPMTEASGRSSLLIGPANLRSPAQGAALTPQVQELPRRQIRPAHLSGVVNARALDGGQRTTNGHGPVSLRSDSNNGMRGGRSLWIVSQTTWGSTEKYTCTSRLRIARIRCQGISG